MPSVEPPSATTTSSASPRCWPSWRSSDSMWPDSFSVGMTTVRASTATAPVRVQRDSAATPIKLERNRAFLSAQIRIGFADEDHFSVEYSAAELGTAALRPFD